MQTGLLIMSDLLELALVDILLYMLAHNQEAILRLALHWELEVLI